MRRAARPDLLRIAIPVCGFAGVLLLASLPIAALGFGSYDLNGQAVSPAEYLHRAGWVALVAGVLLLVITRDLHRAAPRGRGLVMLLWLLIGAVVVWSSPARLRLGFAMEIAVLAGLSAWYLYRKRTVAAYFHEGPGTDA